MVTETLSRYASPSRRLLFSSLGKGLVVFASFNVDKKATGFEYVVFTIVGLVRKILSFSSASWLNARLEARKRRVRTISVVKNDYPRWVPKQHQ